jgi:hypothetical protein
MRLTTNIHPLIFAGKYSTLQERCQADIDRQKAYREHCARIRASGISI